MCPTLAITNSVRNAIAMGLATTFVLVVLQQPDFGCPQTDPQAGPHRDLHRHHRDLGHHRRLSGESDQHPSL